MTLLLLGCSASHASRDAGLDAASCSGEPPWCVELYAEHVCSDYVPFAECVDERWVCPAGLVPGDSSLCWCSMWAGPECECTRSGWVCPRDGGVASDAGGCPSDPSAEGTPCFAEGRTCGRCTDPCGFCNLLRCEGGVWRRLEATPPPGPCVSFECGPELRCDATTQYCQHTYSDVAGEPDGWSCNRYPDGCASCECLAGDRCDGTSETGITVTWFGG